MHILYVFFVCSDNHLKKYWLIYKARLVKKQNNDHHPKDEAHTKDSSDQNLTIVEGEQLVMIGGDGEWDKNYNVPRES